MLLFDEVESCIAFEVFQWAHLMLHDKSASSINIVECVRRVRAHRLHAVQTIAQFQFIYMGIQRHIFLVEVSYLFGLCSKRSFAGI